MLRKVYIRLSLATATSMQTFMDLNVYELSDVLEEIQKARKKK